MTKAFEMKIREPIKDWAGDEITVTDITIKPSEELFVKLVNEVHREMADSAIGFIEWQGDDERPVIDISFEHLESLRFDFKDMLSAITRYVSSSRKRDALVRMLEDAAQALIAMKDDGFDCEEVIEGRNEDR